MAKYISIEVELSQVRVAEIDRGKKNSKVKSCFWFPTPRGVVEDGMIRDTRGLGKVLKKELENRKIKTKKTYLVVTSTRIASREVRIPYVRKNKIQSIVNANASDYFPIDITKYVISYSILDVETVNSMEVDKPDHFEEKKTLERQYHLMVYAAPRSISSAYYEVAHAAGLTVLGLTFAGDSVFYAVKPEYRKQTYILMKIEEHTTGITIVKNGRLALQRSVNHGVDNALETLRIFLGFGENLDSRGALEVLCNRNCICSALDISPEETEPEDTDEFVKAARREVTESLRYLVGNISRIMDYYISRNTDVNFDTILCCGIGAQVLGLPILKAKTNIVSWELQRTKTVNSLTAAETR